MNQQVRELLVTTKVAQHWEGDFDKKVDELMSIVSTIDTEEQVYRSCELLDVYHKTKQKAGKIRRRKKNTEDKPFEFLVFRN